MQSKHDLTTTELLILQSEMRSVEKSLGVAFLMLLGGHLGLHRFYLQRKGSGAAQLVLFILCAVFYLLIGMFSVQSEALTTIVSLILGALVLALVIWVIVDACLLSGMTRAWNEQAEQDIIRRIVDIRPASTSPVEP
jgi:TM2 domain-containing membrane protein YozV